MPVHPVVTIGSKQQNNTTQEQVVGAVMQSPDSREDIMEELGITGNFLTYFSTK
jgi:hypothetical protein